MKLSFTEAEIHILKFCVDQAVDLGISWIDRLTDFLYFLYRWKYQNMVLLSFEHFEKIRIFPKSGGRSSKIVPATPISILSF